MTKSKGIRAAGPATSGGWHQLLERKRGKAKSHKCAECGGRAFDWALKAEYVGPEVYGTNIFVCDLEAYEPLCRKCHNIRDRAGVKYSEETRRKMSSAKRGKPRPWQAALNQSRDEVSVDVRVKMSEAQRRRFEREPVSAATRARLSASLTGKVRTPEMRERYRAAAIKREAVRRTRRGEPSAP